MTSTVNRILVGYRASSPVMISSDSSSSACLTPPKKRKMIFGKDEVAVPVGVPEPNTDVPAPCKFGSKEHGIEEGEIPVCSQNLEKWETLDYDLSLCQELVMLYVQPETYKIPFNQLDGFRRIVKLQVCQGFISVEVGTTKFFNHMRSLLCLHSSIARGKGDCLRFDLNMLRDAVDTMDKVETEIYDTGYYGMYDGDSHKSKSKLKVFPRYKLGVPRYQLTKDEMKLIRKAASESGGSVLCGTVKCGSGPEEHKDIDSSVTFEDDDASTVDDMTSSTD